MKAWKSKAEKHISMGRDSIEHLNFTPPQPHDFTLPSPLFLSHLSLHYYYPLPPSLLANTIHYERVCLSRISSHCCFFQMLLLVRMFWHFLTLGGWVVENQWGMISKKQTPVTPLLMTRILNFGGFDSTGCVTTSTFSSFAWWHSKLAWLDLHDDELCFNTH